MQPVLRHGSRNAAVGELRSRLSEFGLEPPICSEWFDDVLELCVVEFQMTHSGPDGLPLKVDGVVGDNTWWSLRADPHVDEFSVQGIAIPPGLTPMRRRVVMEALKWLSRDVREVPRGSNRGPFIDTCLPDWVTKGTSGKGLPWCGFAAMQITFDATGQWPNGKGTEGSCLRAYRDAKTRGNLRPTPIPGDLFVILYRATDGRLTGKGHMGIVARADDARMNGLEGNFNNAYRASLREQSVAAGFINWFPDHEQPQEWERGVIDVRGPKTETTR